MTVISPRSIQVTQASRTFCTLLKKKRGRRRRKRWKTRKMKMGKR